MSGVHRQNARFAVSREIKRNAFAHAICASCPISLEQNRWFMANPIYCFAHNSCIFRGVFGNN